VKISVVIATRDRAAFLERTLASLAQQIGAPSFEVVVADNGSSDDTAGVVERARAAANGLEITRVFVPEPNRGAARNAGVAQARGAIVAFVDDDVWLPPGFLAAHAAAHTYDPFPAAVSGPILNVPSYDARPKPSVLNYSGAFFCTCNVSVPRTSLLGVGGFDEGFDLYGWEDTELGLRLRHVDVRHRFAWDAYLWHIKPPRVETLEVVLNKTVERATMAARLLRKEPGLRTKLATGAYGLNLARSAVFAPRWSLAAYRKLATSSRVPTPVRSLARAQLLDGAYRTTLVRALAESER
jgi:glycosyltransferase involved in cell wall biosynthesis